MTFDVAFIPRLQGRRTPIHPRILGKFASALIDDFVIGVNTHHNNVAAIVEAVTPRGIKA